MAQAGAARVKPTPAVRGRRCFSAKSSVWQICYLADEDDMVQKGLGWLLRKTAEYDAKRTVAYLMKIRGRASSTCFRIVAGNVCHAVRNTKRAGKQSSPKTKLFESQL
jgi:hypothetical protein